MTLRDRGIYFLPNGRQLVASGNTLMAKENNGVETTTYEINDHGRLLQNGKLTAWDVSNLWESGMSAMAWHGDDSL